MYKENFNYLIGKIIKSIKEINLPDDFEETESENEDCNVITTHLYEIKFKNSSETFIFQMKNYSNGYYDGYIVSSIEF